MWSTNLMILLLSTASIAKPKSYDTSIHWMIEDRFPDDIESDMPEEANTEAITIIPVLESDNESNESNEYLVFRDQGKTISVDADVTKERVPIWKPNIGFTNTLQSVGDEIIFGLNDKQTTVPMVNTGQAISTISNTITERLPKLNSNKRFVSKEITGTLNVKRYLVADKNDFMKSNNATKDVFSAKDPKKESKGESVEEVNVTRKRNNVTKDNVKANTVNNHAQKNYSEENMSNVDKIKSESNNKKETASKKSDSFKNYLSGGEITLDDRGIFDIVDNCSSDQVYDKNLGRCMGVMSAEAPPEDDFSNLLIFT